MENISKNIFSQEGFNSNVSPAGRLSKTSTKYLHDLNSDCLRVIFQHLDLAAQFALTQSSKHFFNIIVYDIWYPYFKTTFNISRDYSIRLQTIDLQADLLDLILKNFPRVNGISLEIFQRCMEKSAVKDFPQTISLSIHNKSKTFTTLDIKEFSKFPFLENLNLENITIDFSNKTNVVPLKSLHLKNVIVLNHVEGEIFKTIFTSYLEKFTMRSLPGLRISMKNFIEFPKCVQLKELTLTYDYLYNTDILDLILHLPSLQILTIEASDDFDFTGNFHITYNAVLERFSENSCKAIKGLQFKGIPKSDFFLSPYLQDLNNLSWVVNNSYFLGPDDSVQCNREIIQLVESFYEYVINNKNLQHLYLVDNILHRKRLLADGDFEEKIHELRRINGLGKLNIVNDNNKVYTPFRSNEYLGQFEQDTIRFFIEENV